MTKTWCVGGRHYSESINQIVYEKLNHKTQKLVEIIEEKCDFYGRIKFQIFTK